MTLPRRLFSSYQLSRSPVLEDDHEPVAAVPERRGHCFLVPPSGVVNNDDDKKTTESGSSSDDQDTDYYHLFSLAEKKGLKIYKYFVLSWQRKLLFPDDAIICVGSSHGWLTYMHPRNCSVYLLNPFIGSTPFPYIPLPPIETLPAIRAVNVRQSGDHNHPSPSPSLITEFIIFDKGEACEVSFPPEELSRIFMTKLVLSSAPQDNNQWTAVAIQSEERVPAFCKPGDTRWTVLDGSLSPYSDILYFTKKKRFYAVAISLSDVTSIEAWDLSNPSSPQCSLIHPSLCPRKPKKQLKCKRHCCIRQHYLVESLDDLLLVVRFVTDNEPSDNEEFDPCSEREDVSCSDPEVYDVYGLDLDDNRLEYLECLGDRALFVGLNHSFSLSALSLDFPELRRNSIYFTDDNYQHTQDPGKGLDNGVFSLEDGCITPCFPQDVLKSIEPSPVWVSPTAY